MVPFLIPIVGLVAYGIWRSFRPAPGTTVALDPNMPDATNRAVTIASVREKDPRALRAFAGSMLHDFPIAASHLLAKARILELKAAPVTAGFNLFKALGTAIHDAGPIGALAVAIPGVGQSFVPLAMAASAAAAGHTKAVKNAPIIKNVREEADRLGKNKFIHGAAGLYGQLYNQAHPAYWAAGIARGLADKTLHGERLDRAIRDQGAKVASYFTEKAQIAAQAEGVPPGVVPALQAGAAVASGHPVSPQAVAAAAQLIPGGGAAVDALQQGANQAAQVVEANGGSQALQAMAQARDAIHPAVRHAFDIGASLPIAQHLQQTGFTEAEPLLAGGLATKVAHGLGMRDAPAESASELQVKLPPNAAQLAKRLAAAIVSNPAYARMTPRNLAIRFSVPEPVARAVLASTHHIVPGAPVVDGDRLYKLTGRPAPPPPNQNREAWVNRYANQPGY